MGRVLTDGRRGAGLAAGSSGCTGVCGRVAKRTLAGKAPAPGPVVITGLIAGEGALTGRGSDLFKDEPPNGLCSDDPPSGLCSDDPPRGLCSDDPPVDRLPRVAIPAGRGVSANVAGDLESEGARGATVAA